MEYAIRQSAAIAREGVEVHFLCKPSFPVDRLEDGIVVDKFASEKPPFCAVGKLSKVWRLTLGQRRNAKKVAELATNLAQTSSPRHQLLATRNLPNFAKVVVLFACYKEYFAPFWVGPLRSLARRGAVIGTIAHDPVRDFVVGPLWWHRWSVGLGYSFVRHIFVHDNTPVDFGGKQPVGIQVHQIPHGPYEVAEPKIGRLEMRKRLGFSSDLTSGDTTERPGGGEMEQPKVGPKGEGVVTSKSKSTEVEAGPCLDRLSCASESGSLASGLAVSPVSESLTRSASASVFLFATSYAPLTTPAPPDVVFLTFGQIRDGKNLDLFLRAMTRLPENVKLLVAGKGDSGSSRPPEFYKKLAEELGVASRCRWDIRRIPDEEVGDFFAACDMVLVTYSAKFRSASGVLNAAVSARKPVLASSGPSALKTAVQKYHLGVFVEPDDLEEIIIASNELATRHQLHSIPAPAWDRYESENSWGENARIILESFESDIA